MREGGPTLCFVWREGNRFYLYLEQNVAGLCPKPLNTQKVQESLSALE